MEQSAKKEPMSKVFIGIFILTLIITIAVVIGYFITSGYKKKLISDERPSCPVYVCPGQSGGNSSAWRVVDTQATAIEQASGAVEDSR